MAARNEGAFDLAALGGLRGLVAIALWTAGALFGTWQLVNVLPLGFRGFSGAPEFDRRLAAWSPSYGFATACEPTLNPDATLVLVNPVVGPGEPTPVVPPFDADASGFAYPLAPRTVDVQWDLSTPFLPSPGRVEYVALWQRADRTASEQRAGDTEKQLLSGQYHGNVVCNYIDQHGDQGTVYTTSDSVTMRGATSSISAKSSLSLPTPYGSAAAIIRAYLGLLSLWLIGVLLLLAFRPRQLRWPLAAGLGLPVGCLAAAVEVTMLSFAHVDWRSFVIAVPWLLLILVFAVTRRWWRLPGVVARPQPRWIDAVPLLGPALLVGLLAVLAPFGLPFEDGFSAGYLKARTFWASGSILPFYQHAADLFYAQPAHPPLIGLVLDWLYVVVGGVDEHATLVLWPMLLGSLFVVLYALLGDHMSRPAALFAFAGIAFVASDITRNSLLFGYADLPLSLFLLGSIGVVVLWTRQPTLTMGLPVLASTLAAGAAWTKEEGRLAGPVLLLLIAGTAYARRSLCPRHWLLIPVVSAIGYICLIVPLVVLHFLYPIPEVIVHSASLGQLTERLPIVVFGLILRLVQHWFLPLAILSLALWQLRRDRQNLRVVAVAGFLAPVVLIGAQLAADVGAIDFNPFEVTSELAVTAGRLLTQLSPIVYFVALGVWARAMLDGGNGREEHPKQSMQGRVDPAP
jgi:hypothetical protein